MADGGIGEAALLSELAPEVIGADFLAPAAAELGGLGGLLGGGVAAAGTGLGAGSLAGGLGSITAAAAPEAFLQAQTALQAAAPGANQIVPELAGNLGTPAQSAMNVASQNFNPEAVDRFAGTQNLFNPDVQAAQSAMLQGGAESVPSLTPEQMAQRADLYGNAGYGAGAGATPSPFGGLGDLASQAMNFYNNLKPAEKLLYGGTAALAVPTIMGMFKNKPRVPQMAPYSGPLSKFRYDPSQYTPNIPAPPTPYAPQYTNYRSYAGGGPVEAMANANAIGQNTGYPLANIHHGAYATPYQTPISENVLSGPSDTNVDPYTGEERLAAGGIASLGAYSDGGQMLKGPGDGMSDNIPATIAGKQPARLANDEFVVPADVVSHLGNGSSDAGAKQLYKMMDRVRQARTGKKAQGKEIKPDKYLPA